MCVWLYICICVAVCVFVCVSVCDFVCVGGLFLHRYYSLAISWVSSAIFGLLLLWVTQRLQGYLSMPILSSLQSLQRSGVEAWCFSFLFCARVSTKPPSKAVCEMFLQGRGAYDRELNVSGSSSLEGLWMPQRYDPLWGFLFMKIEYLYVNKHFFFLCFHCRFLDSSYCGYFTELKPGV